MPENTSYSCHLDPIGGGSEDDMRLYMKYYASGDERRQWLKDRPNDQLPDPRAEGRWDPPVA